jgi:hypothetical protein
VHVDCVYVAAATHDARFTRICVASIRRFFPTIPIQILRSAAVSSQMTDELAKYWDATPAAISAGDYGWGFVKLEPLFGSPGERFLVLDSDTVLTGPVLDLWCEGDGPFLVDDERQSEADTRRLYYDWKKLRAFDPDARAPQFVFNSGQWFGTAGVLKREDFAPWIEWTMPRRLKRPESLMPGDQGVLNYVLNKKMAGGEFAVARRTIMRWPGHSMAGIDSPAVARGTAPALIVHWAGMKKARLRAMVGADLLDFFEREYYRRLPFGRGRRVLAGWRSAGAAIWEQLRLGARIKALAKPA